MVAIRVFAAVLCGLLMAGCGTVRGLQSTMPASDLDVQALIDRTPDGGIVRIPAGRYVLERGLVIEGRSRLTLLGEPGTAVLVKDVNVHVLTVRNSSAIQVENLHLRHQEPLREYQCHGSVVRIENSNGVTIIGCELDGCGAIGVAAYGSTNITVRNCSIHHNTFNAFYLDSCREIELAGNTVENNGNFAQMYRIDGLMMHDNTIHDNGGYWEE